MDSVKPISVIHFIGFGAPTSKGNKRSIGGVETFVYDLVHNLDPMQYKHTVLYATDSPMIKKFEGEQTEVLMYAIKSKFNLFAIISLAILLKKRKIDIIHSHGLRYDFVGAFISLCTGIPLVITRHVAIVDHLIPAWKKMLFVIFDVFSMLVAKSVIAISDDVKIKIKRYHFLNKQKLQKIYCGINFQKYSDTDFSPGKLKTELKIERAIKVIGTVVQLSRYKNIRAII